MKLCHIVSASLVTAALWAGGTAAQAQHPPTVWHALGIPQAFKHVHDSTFNRSGMHPGLERKPPLKAIGDPVNLLSTNPAIKKAAEIKMEEDLKPQKIKALRYLATIGCGCYDGVATALKDALEDCTEEVRLVAAQSIQLTAGSQCSRCGICCCSPDHPEGRELVMKMYERAYERDEQGCYLEPSERVREALKVAICACCPGAPGAPAPQVGPPIIEDGGIRSDPEGPRPGPFSDPGSDVEPLPDGPPPPPLPEPATEDEIDAATDRRAELPSFDFSESGKTKPAKTLPANTTSSRRGWQGKQVSVEEEIETVTPPLTSATLPAPTAQRLPPIVPAGDVRTFAGPVRGYVASVNSARGLVEIHFNGNVKPAKGDEIIIYHEYLLGRERMGYLDVVGYSGDHVIAAYRGTGRFKIATGDEAVVDNPTISRR